MASRDNTVQAKRADGETVTVSRAAFDGVYQYRGWTLVEDEKQDDKPAAKKSTSRKKSDS